MLQYSHSTKQHPNPVKNGGVGGGLSSQEQRGPAQHTAGTAACYVYQRTASVTSFIQTSQKISLWIKSHL